ncbi:ATP-binding protein [Primorskyibacter sp. S187A]|uniref:ATP-binding protein n=1 Tax=Primorskyibacter sp. S187A TaxID=3415130 RepID=UPI003C7EB9F0
MQRSYSVFTNARSLRALAAVFAIIALMVLFGFHQREMQDAKDRAMFAVSATSWKVSELILEAQRFSQSLRLHATGETSRSDLQLRFDILWSRVDVVESTDVEQDLAIKKALEDFRTFNDSMDGILYSDGLIPPRLAVGASYEVTQLANSMRVAWVNAFAGRQFADASLQIIEQQEGMRRQTILAVLVGLIGVYLVAEIFLAVNAQKKEAKLEAEAQAAAMASAAKTRFLANVSHEVRTPLNGILGMASELAESDLKPDQRECLRIISHAGDILLHTLNDVLDLSKVESGQLELEIISFNLHEIVHSAVALYKPNAEAKGLSLSLSLADDVPRFVTGDGQRISQVMHNLIGNAVKFTDIGEVTLRIARAKATGYLRFEVQDTGVGIPDAVHEKIFDPFSQADGSVTRKKGGTGLGLSISRHLCVEMGGYLKVKSHLGKGSTFWFELPLVETATAANPSMDTRPAEVIDFDTSQEATLERILIVDDNTTNRLVAKRFLKTVEAEVVEADGGQVAVDLVHERAFDVILMDIQMPEMCGREATRKIRELEKRLSRPPARILAVTANVMTHQIDEYMESGMDDVLPKPLSKKLLIEKLTPPPDKGVACA